MIKNPDKWKVAKLPEFIEEAQQYIKHSKTTIKVKKPQSKNSSIVN